MHVVIQRRKSGDRWYNLKTEIDIVGVYLPPLAPHPKTTLHHSLSNIDGDPANVVVLGDVNIDEFDHEHLSKFSISIWELGYGQLINKFTRPKKCTRSNEREGTVLDHIYVKCPKSNELLPSICTRFKKYLKKQAN